MKNCEYLLKKKVPFQDIEVEGQVSCDFEKLIDTEYSYTFSYKGNSIGNMISAVCLSNNKALLEWLQMDHEVLNLSEKELVKRAVSDLGRLNDPDIYVRWYFSQPHDHVLEIGEDREFGAYDKHDILWRMKLTDTGFEFNGMLQDQRYSLKELGI